MQLLLVRHARPDTVVGAADGVADPGLTALGRQQAAAMAGWLAAEQVDDVVSSPARRAVETATPLSSWLGTPVVTRPALLEFDFGGADYVPFEEDIDAHPAWEDWRAWYAPVEAGSPVDEFRERVASDLADVAAANPSRTVAVVCHGGTINAYVSHVLGTATPMVFVPDYTGVTRVLVARDGRRTVVSINEAGHLRGLPTP